MFLTNCLITFSLSNDFFDESDFSVFAGSNILVFCRFFEVSSVSSGIKILGLGNKDPVSLFLTRDDLFLNGFFDALIVGLCI